MSDVKLIAACAATLMLAACASAPPSPQRPLTPQEWCATAAELMALSADNPGLQAVTIERMRNKGCLR
jgi:hypothetical protein